MEVDSGFKFEFLQFFLFGSVFFDELNNFSVNIKSFDLRAEVFDVILNISDVRGFKDEEFHETVLEILDPFLLVVLESVQNEILRVKVEKVPSETGRTLKRCYRP